MSHQLALTTYIAAFVSELVQTGVEDVVISPGSRSTPIAMVMAEHPDLQIHVHVDERSAAFFALGIAKASQKPTVLLCTSGTAAANYFPAIAEAKISRVPLVVLTADRPHELRDVGAPQTIDQIHLYGQHVKWFVEMALPEHTDEMVRYARTVGARAVATSITAPAGPVHINFPLREPLIPALDEDLFHQQERESGYVKIKLPTLVLRHDEYEHYANVLTTYQRGIIVCGQMEDKDFAEVIVTLAKKLQFPILADPLSQLRSGSHSSEMIVDAYDTLLRFDDVKRELKPDIIIRFGSMPVSKSLSFFLKENRTAQQIVVDGGMGWRDPAMLSTEMVFCNETIFCVELANRLSPVHDSSFFAKKWLEINQTTKKSLSKVNDIEQMSEGKLFYKIAELVPEDSTIFVGNSMPVRDLDSFFHQNPKNIKIMANRGANGIDGTVSTALGAATRLERLYLILGDLTFFHDLNGMVAAKLNELNITIIIINNNGGGIFSFLPQATNPRNFELLFGTPLHLDFSHAVHMYGGKFVSISNWDHLTTTLIGDRDEKGLRVLEIVTNRENNVNEHRELWNFVSQEIKSSRSENV